MENKRYPFGMIVGGMMHGVMRLLKKRALELANIELSMEQMGLLIAISCHNEEVILQDMAAIMGKDKSAVLRTIDSMEAKDLIKRVSDKTDRRKKYLMITKKGERVIEQYMEMELELVTELHAGLSEEDLAAFYKVVNHISAKTKLM